MAADRGREDYMEKPTSNLAEKSLDFIRDVAAYFMDFLETDFHKRKLPKRAVKFRNDDNLLIGLNLQKYPTFCRIVRGLIEDGFEKDTKITIEKGAHKTNLPKSLLDLIKLLVEKIDATSTDTVIKKISDEIEKLGTLHAEEYDVALTKLIESAVAIVRETLVMPFVNQIEKPLQNLELGDEENIFSIEEELTAVLTKPIESKISELLNLFIAKNAVDIAKELESVFALTEVKMAARTFFENLQVADLYSEIFEMDRNRNILDKQEFYLYFGDISFGGVKYPIFYIPFAIVRLGDEFEVDFDSQIYINKKALEFIVQEYNAQKGKVGNLKTASERIIYLGSGQDGIQEYFQSVLNELINFFELAGSVEFQGAGHKTAKGQLVRVSNTCHISLFDKSDEALVNDYEEILQQLAAGAGTLAGIFGVLIDDFIQKNPTPFNPQVEEEWDNTSTTERLVPASPIPLNSEQLQILSAIRKDGCKYIIVEGPPGTGKSHTITAIIFDAILRNQSVLVLSDKKEALDVVEDKITQTMNKVRFDKNFQNPILRLGKTGSTYGTILASSSIENIKAHFNATKKDFDVIEQNIEKLTNSLREDLEAEILAYDGVDINEIHEMYDLESHIEQNSGTASIDIPEALAQADALTELEELRTLCATLLEKLKSPGSRSVIQALGVDVRSLDNTNELQRIISRLSSILLIADKVKTVFPANISSLESFGRLSSRDIVGLDTFIKDYESLRHWLFGYLFSKKGVEELNLKFKQTFVSCDIPLPHERLREIKSVRDIVDYIDRLGKDSGIDEKFGIDPVGATHRVMVDAEFGESVREFIAINESLEYLRDLQNKYPLTCGKAGIVWADLASMLKNGLLEMNDLDFDKSLRYVGLRQKLEKDFARIPELNYEARKKNLEDLVTARATHRLDGRLINFYQYNLNDAKTLRDIIKTKRRFPKDEFRKLKEAFPCILSGIRDYAEYIPLEPEIFDLVIIDEASQVSIAQAFPALLRAKKVLILGDKKQFSNVKAAQARSETNREYLNRLGESFKRNVSGDVAKEVRLEKFNIKTSILEFFNFISNYNIQLLKHFRGYKEIISYSNKYFYRDSLQVMKIRGKSVDDVLKFSYVNPEENNEPYPNTNVSEIKYIISELQRLREADRTDSVGIVTPHTNQQKLLMEMITKLPERDYYFDKLKLKIMTFDTCQGEERDIIYYPMVATKQSDRLWGVFIKDLNSVDIEEDGQIKAQRLNVGLSRAKECMHFVLSKPLDEYAGSIGEALRHYYFVLQEAKKERGVKEVDSKSKMEPEVLNWFYQTKFWTQNKDSIEFIPQFEIGKYLKQFDRTYAHPNYKVDFLLIYRDESHREHKIIIEYDGFKEHFKDIDEINEFNYKNYYSDADVYREKVLESYGYKFLRINRFNIGKQPIVALDKRIGDLVRVQPEGNPLLTNIHETITGLKSGEMKECPKCHEVREQKDFKDPSLITGYGRFCSFCKNKRAAEISSAVLPKSPPVLSNQSCPRCGARMVLRSGRRGKFYGCSKFPYCKGTRNYSGG